MTTAWWQKAISEITWKGSRWK